MTATNRIQNEGLGYSMSISGNNLAISGAGGDINGVTSPGQPIFSVPLVLLTPSNNVFQV
ncbi:hypothetical protein KRR40_40305 [Niabella defluvii]|nr:hypothetical protein KRR40_40305 [Niabella sp. I65]